MGTLQRAFDEAIAQLPRLGVQKIVADKLKAAGSEDPQIAKQIAEAIMKGNVAGALEVGDDIDIVIEEKDLEQIRRATAAFIESLPELVRSMAGDTADRLVEGFIDQWRRLPASAEQATVQSRINADWAEPLDRLRMLIALCEQEGDAYNVAHLSRHRRRTGGQRAEALARLHIRACRIAKEIVLLVENGFAEGAQARWRTLHEVAVAATLIGEGGDALARRYFDHEAVERKRALADHRRASVVAGRPAAPKKDTVGIESAFRRAIKKYGRSFQGMYGWAGGQLGIPNEPSFHHLQKAAGSLTLKLRYRIASFDTHASTRTLEQPVHRWDPTTHIPGAFATGLDGPAIDTAQAIVQVTSLMRDVPWDMDDLAMQLTLIRLRDATAKSWLRCAERIALREERNLKRAVRRAGAQRRFGYEKARPTKDRT